MFSTLNYYTNPITKSNALSQMRELWMKVQENVSELQDISFKELINIDFYFNEKNYLINKN